MQRQAQPRRAAPALLLGLLLGLLAWSGSVVRGGFAFDDREVVLENPVVVGALPWSAAFRRDYMHHLGDAGQYRPLATLSFTVDHALWGESARGYHLTNLALHLLVVALAAGALGALRRGSPDPTWGVLGLALFALHPALADSVAWVAGRTSMLAAAGGLVGLWLVAASPGRANALLGGALLLLGLLAKEDAIVFAPAVLVVAARRSRVHALWAGSGVAVAVAIYLGLRTWALGEALPHASQAPLADLSLDARLEFGGRGVLEALRLIVWPFAYPPNYRSAPGFTTLAAPGLFAWTGVVVLCAAIARGASRRASPARLALGLAAIAFLPFLHIVPVGEVFAPRFLYLPLLFAVPFLDRLLTPLPRRLLLVLALVAIALAWQRAGAYASRAAYAEAVLARVPGDARSWNDLGIGREEDGDIPGARDAWRQAIAADAAYGRPYSNLARLAVAADQLEEAERLLRRATELGPANPVAHVNLGAVLLRRDRPEEALQAFERAAELAPGLGAAWRGLGHALARSGRADEAAVALRRALALDPTDELARRLLESL